MKLAARFGSWGMRRRVDEDLGLGLAPGDAHYRAFVGPPGDFDLIAAMSFNLLTTLGLRQHHVLLDVGCGSLRLGRLLIPYLNRGNYIGIEPASWLLREGISRETGRDQVRIKRASLHTASTPDVLPREKNIDFAVAQSIFSHGGPDLVHEWLSGVSTRLTDSGAFIATWVLGAEDCRADGWVYPECVTYSRVAMAAMARRNDLEFLELDWWHPRQSWALFRKPAFDVEWIRKSGLTWNARFESRG